MILKNLLYFCCVGLALSGAFGVLPATLAQDQSGHFESDVQTAVKPWTHLNFYNNPQNFKFAIVSDRAGGVRPGVFKDAAKKLNLIMPEFVMSVGDFIPGNTADRAQLEKEWAEFDAQAERWKAIEQADKCVGILRAALEELKLRESTLIILSSDHCGAGRTHGPDDPRSRTIPWIVNGPGIRKNFDLTRIGDLDVETYDTFTTTCAMLGIPIERRVRGKFVSQVLEKQELLQQPQPPSMQPATQPAP